MKSMLYLFTISMLIIFLSCRQSPSQRQSPDLNENSSASLKDTCEGPDANINCDFTGMPEKLTSVMNIAKETEAGTRMIIKGKVLKADGTPYPDVIIYAYHTDNEGYYSKKGDEKGVQKWHGHLHGWCRTDENEIMRYIQ